VAIREPALRVLMPPLVQVFSVAILSLFVATLRAASQDHASRVDAFGFDFLSDSLILAAR